MAGSPSPLLSFIPIDRRLALAQGQNLPDRALGAVLVADVSGFTPLTEALALALGPQRGAEALTRHLDTVYGALITEVEQFGGSVVSFSGDAITCWFDQDSGLRATAAALAMQAAMQALPPIAVSEALTVRPALKVAVAQGPVRRFVVGDPNTHHLDILAGHLLDTVGMLQNNAEKGEVVLDGATAQRLDRDLTIIARRVGKAIDPPAVVVGALTRPVEPSPWSTLPLLGLDDREIRPWLLPAIYERLRGGAGEFLADLRPAVALFVSFGGIDYDDDDDAGLLLDAYVRSAQATLARYEGLLLNLSIGDKGSYLHGVVGAPLAHDDDAARAVAAALELVVPPTQLGYITQVRIGIAQGQMYSGAYGCSERRTYGVQGDKTNLAARLMAQAQPGEILCDDDVYRQARRRWAFDALPPVRVKGKAGLIRVYRPTGRPATQLGRESGVASESHLVGRVMELARLEAALDELAAGRGGVITIEGEAGIGKSRLVEEFIRLARERGLSGLIGAGQSIEQHTPYRAWRDLLSSFFDLDELGDPTERRARVQQVSQDLIPKMLGRLPLLNDILAIGFPETALTSALDAALRQESLTGLVVALLRMWSRERPLIVVLEDAHWLDSLSWQLTLQVARALLIERSPLLLVLAGRELAEQSPGAQVVSTLSSLAQTTTIRVGSLEPDETVALATLRLGLPAGSLPDQVATLVSERAGGNPFFAEELAYTLRDRGLIRIEPAPASGGPSGKSGDAVHCVVSSELAAVRALLPDTLQGLILSRIDRLPADQQFTLKIAAVIGRRFGYLPLRDTLMRFSPATDDAVTASLAALTRHDLTTLEAAEPELTYLFKHIVIHEVAYETLLFAQRQQIHRAVAEWYVATGKTEQGSNDDPTRIGAPEASPGSPYLPLLVYHFHQAEEWDQERRYARLAGEDAARKHANAEALQYLTRALELTPATDKQGQFDLVLARENVYELQGARDEQAHDLNQLRAWSEAFDAGRRAAVALRQANLAYQTGDYPAAVSTSNQAVALAAAAGQAEAEAKGYLQWGMALWQQANYPEAQARNEQALKIARRAGLVQIEADCVRQKGIIFDTQGDYPQARAALEAALKLHQKAADQRGEAKALNSLGVVTFNQEDYAAASHFYHASLQLKQAIGDRYGQGITLQNLGIVADAQGQLDSAHEYFEAALTLCREIGDREGEASALDGLGTAALRLGDYTAALAWTRQAIDISRQIGERINECTGLTSLSAIHASLGEYEMALGDALHARAIAREVGVPYHEAGTLVQMGHSLLELDRSPEAAEAFRAAIEIYEQLGKAQFALEPLSGLAHAALVVGSSVEARAVVNRVVLGLLSDTDQDMGVPIRIYLGAYRVLVALADPRAPAILARGYTDLQSRAGQIRDEGPRRLFLENVRWHRDLISIKEQNT
jgi:adenylate cyclase